MPGDATRVRYLLKSKNDNATPVPLASAQVIFAEGADRMTRLLLKIFENNGIPVTCEPAGDALFLIRGSVSGDTRELRYFIGGYNPEMEELKDE
jgi:hypothetical protein